MVEILTGLIAALLGITWVFKKSTQKISQKQKSGKNSVNIAIANNDNKVR